MKITVFYMQDALWTELYRKPFKCKKLHQNTLSPNHLNTIWSVWFQGHFQLGTAVSVTWLQRCKNKCFPNNSVVPRISSMVFHFWDLNFCPSIHRSQLHLHTSLSICTYWFKSRTFGGKEKALKLWVKETHTHTHSQTLTILGEESRNQVKALKVKLNQFSLVIQLHAHYSGHQFS